MAAPFPSHPLTRLVGPTGPVHALTFSSGSGQYILTGSQDRLIRLFNPASSSSSSSTPSSSSVRQTTCIQTFAAHGHEILDLAVSADNAHFASVGGDRLVFLWDVATATTLRRFAGHVARINAVAYAGESGGGARGAGIPGGESVVVSGGYDGTVKFWDLRARGDTRPILSLSEARDAVSCLDVKRAEVVVGSIDGRVRTYDVAAAALVTDVVAPDVGVTSVEVTGNGDAVLVSAPDSKVRLMDRVSGRCLQTFRDPEGFRNEEYRVRSCLAMGDAYAISGSEDGRVVVWDVLTGNVVKRVWHREGGEKGGPTTKKDVVSAVAWNQLRKQWASAGGDGSVVVWGMEE